MDKDWTGNKKSTYTTIGSSAHALTDRETNDYYATEPRCIQELYEVMGSQFSNNIWEPACGQLHLSNKLKEICPNINIRNSDIIDREVGCEIIDFLKYDNPDSFDGDIITNPPYKYALEFVQKSLETVKFPRFVCMFLKITFLEGQKRRKFFDKNPPKVVYVYSSRRICAFNGDFDNVDSSACCYAWFVWQKGVHSDTILKWI